MEHINILTQADIPFHFNLLSWGRGIFGILVLLFISWLCSTNRKAIDYRLVGIGLAAQLLIAIAILYIPPVQHLFEFLGSIFIAILGFTREGSQFLLGNLMDVKSFGFVFAFQVLPTIIFFSALTSLLFYLGIIQKVVFVLAWIMTKALRISGAESLSVAGNIFLGQTESPLLIKAYLSSMNRSEIFLVMVGGMATLAGGVLAAYISFLGNGDPVQETLFAKHLLSASIMAAPGAVVISKILFPQTEKIDSNIEVTKEKVGSNILDAVSNGTSEGLKLAINVAGMLLVFIALMAFGNGIMRLIGRIPVWGDYDNLNAIVAHVSGGKYDSLSIQCILGYALSPLMFIMGVCKEDMTIMGQILGQKIAINEFIGYTNLADLRAHNAFADPKSIIMATYMLCGFANFSSIGIQIGGIGALAPNRRKWLSEFGLRALLAGTITSCISATIIGMIMG